jgi:hypothetical protein
MVVFLLVLNIDAAPPNYQHPLEASAAQDISLQSASWKAFDISCVVGDVLSGFFKIIVDGDLFPGDQTKYDNWLLGGIDFLILDEENFNSWNQGHEVIPSYERKNVVELSWSFSVPSDGEWYVIYINNSIYMKQVEMSIDHSNTSDYSLGLILVAIFAASALAGLYIFKRKK